MILHHIRLVTDAQLKDCYGIKNIMTKIKVGRRLMKALGYVSIALCPPNHRRPTEERKEEINLWAR